MNRPIDQFRTAGRSTRRRFLKTLAGAALAATAGPSIVPAAVLGRGGTTAPSERLTFGTIGLGNRNLSNLAYFLEQTDLHCVAVCDCFANRREVGKKMVDDKYGNHDCKATRFHEELLARPDIDFLLIATGDRWHTQLSVLAAQAGKDVYCEKPFSLTIGEGRELANIMRRYGTVWQCGMQRRSNDAYRFVAETVQAGLIGQLRTITTFLGPWHGARGVPVPEPMPDPEVFDYDRWLGQSPWAPYSPIRVASWRNHWNTSAGVIVDMGPHYFDLAQWGHNSELTGPLEFEGTATWFDDGFSTVPKTIEVEARYADGVRVLVRNGDKGVRFDGDEGWIHISDVGAITAEPASILRRGRPEVSWKQMGGHVRNFIDCIRTRRPTASNPELAQRAHTMAHCANICLRLGRKVHWNPQTERFVNDDDANRMLFRTRRAPWKI